MEKRLLILGCKNYPAFSSKRVISSGMEVYVSELVEYLKDSFSITIISADSQPSHDSRVQVVDVPIFGQHFFQPVSLLFFSFFPAIRRRKEVDLVNTQTPLSGLTAYFLSRAFGIPYVVTVHMFSSSSQKTGNRLLSALYYRIEKLVYSKASKIVCAGHSLRRYILDRHNVDPEDVVVINPGANSVPATTKRSTATSDPLDSSNNGEAFRILFLGRLIEENGIMDLLEAMRRIAGEPVKLLIAGNGNLEDAIRRYIEKEQLQDTVVPLGVVSGEAKNELLSSVDLVIRTSYHEVFPVAYLEALSYGVPVIATPVGDTEYLAEQTGGIRIVPVADPEKTANAIVEQMNKGGLDETVIANCKTYLESISWKCQAERTASLFLEILDQQNANRQQENA